jgi:hypothetical protein
MVHGGNLRVGLPQVTPEGRRAPDGAFDLLRDYDDGTLPVENPTEWRKLKIINRNDPAYRPEKHGD